MWIAPDPNQADTRNGCCAGGFNVTTDFSLKDPATGAALDPSTVVLTLTFAADDGLDSTATPTGQRPWTPCISSIRRDFSTPR